MRALFLLALVSLTASADDHRGRFERFCSRTDQGRTNRGFLCDSLAFFEAFPASGAGTFGACSTTPPTGAKGEALTFTRTGSATCAKQGPATTGIADGDLVVLSGDIPRVSSVSGLMMFLRESARTNSCLRSEAFDNAAWSSSTGAGAVTVTADQAIAPDGTLTADRLQVSACPAAGAYSARLQAMALASTRTWSIYVRGNGTSGNIGMIVGGGVTYSGVVCPYISTSWTRCSVSVNAVAGDAWIGCVNAAVASPNPGNTGAADVFVWGAQVEAGDWASGYIPTVAAAASRQAESALSATLTTGIGPNFSIGVTTAYTSASVTTATALQLGSGAPNLASVGRSTNTAAAFTINATSTTPAVSAMGTSVLLRGSLNDSSGTRTAWWNGGSVSAPAASMSASTTALSFGALDAYTGRACADPAPARCDL